VVAQAEIALASRDLRWPSRALDAACATLDAHGDRANAAHARYLGVRRLLLIGRRRRRAATRATRARRAAAGVARGTRTDRGRHRDPPHPPARRAASRCRGHAGIAA
jgi:hypothetical protein